ncbi:MAG: type III pantothenate kinase [Lachnospiraceae bacterium]|nr:type III pantothenate kinase [Lachnospiraceae bacterium]
MIFTIDIGNTNIVAGVVCRDGVRFVERMSTDRIKTDLEYTVLLKTVLDLHDIDLKNIKGSIISSVVPEVTLTIKKSLEKLFGCEPLVVGPGIKTGLNIRIDDPAQLGADMVVAAVAAIREYPLPQIILDLGTATTISVIDDKGVFLGVIIAPGVRTGLRSLAGDASQLPNISIEAPAHVIGKNTIDSMQSGAVFGNASMIDGMIERIEAETGQKATVIATGGIGYRIIPYCSHEIILDDQLLLKGLYIIYNKNVQ